MALHICPCCGIFVLFLECHYCWLLGNFVTDQLYGCMRFSCIYTSISFRFVARKNTVKDQKPFWIFLGMKFEISLHELGSFEMYTLIILKLQFFFSLFITVNCN